MKKLLLGSVVLIALAIGARMLITPENAQAQSMDKASAAVAQDAQKAAKELEKTDGTVQQLARDIEAKDKPAMSRHLMDLTKTKDELKEMQGSLGKDSDAYASARDQTMAEIKSHIDNVIDPITHRQLQRLADRTARNAERKIAAARAAISEIDQILAQADDVEHIAKVIQLSDRMEDGGRDLDSQIVKAKKAAALYSERASTLVATLTNTLAQVAD